MAKIPGKLAVFAISILAVASSGLDRAGPGHSGSAPVVGRLSFSISCSKQAQENVEYGLAMFHSFLFDDAETQFKLAADLDPGCAMAYWAQARFTLFGCGAVCG
jgi:hypothetical protein